MKPMIKRATPKSVRDYLNRFDGSSAGLCEFLRLQRKLYDALEYKHCDFTGWLQLKLSYHHRCSRRSTRTIYRWATGKEA